MYKTQKNLQQRSHHEPPQTPKRPAAFALESVQIQTPFQETKRTTRSSVPRYAKPKNFKPKTATRASTRLPGLATIHGLILQICADMLRILQN